jgi:hypothetical protein
VSKFITESVLIRGVLQDLSLVLLHGAFVQSYQHQSRFLRLAVLGDFGVVWSYRRTRGEHKEFMSEVEYAAFSTLWGIPIFFSFVEALKSRPDLLNGAFALPMSAKPIVFFMGVIFGYLGAKLLVLKEFIQGKYCRPK